jgi:predicted amidohydrolase
VAAELNRVRAPLTVAAAQPPCLPKDVRANALAHASAIRDASARVVVFPELSLTGYELDAAVVAPDDEALTPVVAACAEMQSIALVGAPVAGDGGRIHIGMLRVSPTGVDVAYRKSYLSGEEAKRFSPGNGPVAVDVDEWHVGLGICKDTGVAQHVSETAALDVDLYAAGLVHLPEELGMQDERGVRIAHACGAYVAFASFAGPTGAPFDRTAGASTIWAPESTPLARAGAEPGGIARATLA